MLLHKIIAGLLFTIGCIVMYNIDTPATTADAITRIDIISYCFIGGGLLYIPTLIVIKKIW